MDVFARTTEVQPKTNTLVFYLHFWNPIIAIMFCVANESFATLPSHSILGV